MLIMAPPLPSGTVFIVNVQLCVVTAVPCPMILRAPPVAAGYRAAATLRTKPVSYILMAPVMMNIAPPPPPRTAVQLFCMNVHVRMNTAPPLTARAPPSCFALFLVKSDAVMYTLALIVQIAPPSVYMAWFSMNWDRLILSVHC